MRWASPCNHHHLLALCRKLIEVSTYGPETPLDAYRATTLCLRVRSIGEGAALAINSKGTGFYSLEESPAVNTAPLVSLSS